MYEARFEKQLRADNSRVRRLEYGDRENKNVGLRVPGFS